MRTSRQLRIILLTVVLTCTSAAWQRVSAIQIDPDTLTLVEASEWLESNLGTFTTIKVDSLNLDEESRSVSVQDCHIRLTRRSSTISSNEPWDADVDLSRLFALTVGWKWGPGPFPVGGPVVLNVTWRDDEAMWLSTKNHADAELLGAVIGRAAELCGAEIR